MVMTQSVLLVGNFLSASVGNRGVCEELADRLAAGGWSVLTTSGKYGRVARLADMVSTAWANRRRYEVAQVDVYSGRSFLWAEAVAWVLRRAGKPYVLTLHGGSLPKFAGRWNTRMRLLLTSAAAVTAPSGYLLEHMKPYRSDVRLIPNGLDIRDYPCRIRQHPQPRLIWLRAFHEIYNPSLAVETLALLRRDFPAATLLMIGPDKGDGSMGAALHTAKRLGVQDAVECPGAVPKRDVARWIDRGDIFLNTTLVDNTPVSVLEAMACGACVVSTRVGGIPHLLQDGRDALLVKPDDSEAMASAVRRLLRDHELALRISQNARRKAEQFDWSSVMPQWNSLLRSIS
jgi:glycosyltransferase involved in cell wall biosynthesis